MVRHRHFAVVGVGTPAGTAVRAGTGIITGIRVPVREAVVEEPVPSAAGQGGDHGDPGDDGHGGKNFPPHPQTL